MSTFSWQGRRVLVTGHTGFKGGWLSLWLATLGAETTGFALDPEDQPSLFDTARVGDAVDSVIGDLREPSAVLAVLERAQPEVVFHLAAQSLVRAGYTDPVATYATNVMGTVHVLDAIRHTPSVRAAVVVTTDKCYENREWPWPYRESDALGGRDPYSSSKACAELVTAAYRASFLGGDVRVATARAGNVIGGGDWAADRLIPDIVRAAEQGTSVPIRAPRATRPWQHVLDPLAGYLRLAERLLGEDGGRFAEAWNFGPPAADTRPVADIVDNMARRWSAVRWHLDGDDHPHEARLLTLDSSKAIADLGWRPRLTLDTALDWLVDWYRAAAGGSDARALTEKQIERYEDLP